MIDIQALFKETMNMVRDTRKKYHLTLGGMITKLESIKPSTLILVDGKLGLCSPHSYRGYYEDLAFSASNVKAYSAKKLLALCRDIRGQTFTGYRGGDFLMSGDTPLWLSSYGEASGIAIMDLLSNGTVITKQVD